MAHAEINYESHDCRNIPDMPAVKKVRRLFLLSEFKLNPSPTFIIRRQYRSHRLNMPNELIMLQFHYTYSQMSGAQIYYSLRNPMHYCTMKGEDCYALFIKMI